MKTTTQPAGPQARAMRQRRSLTTLFLTLLALPLAAANPPGSEIAGHWLAVDYMKAIEKTRSPLAAAAETSLTALLIDPSPDGPELRFSVTSFHEGLNYLIKGFEQKGDQVTLMADSLDDDTAELQKLSLEMLKAPDGGRLAAGTLWVDDRVVYRKLPSTVAEYINGLTLAGSYSDEKGKPYTFETSGAANWAGRKLHYEVILDAFESGCDYLMQTDPAKGEDSPPTFTGFRFQNGKLALYELVEKEEMPLDCAEKPFAILTKKP